MISIQERTSDILSRLTDVQGDSATQQWTALCPAHDDSRRSLSVGIGEDEKLLLHCHAGCTSAAVLVSLGLPISTLFSQPAGGRKKGKEGKPEPKGKPVTTYNYRDASGTLLYQVCRFEPKDFRQRRQDPNGGWIYSIKGVKQVPYNLPEILSAPTDESIFVVEGEKDADALATLRQVATCNSGGAGKWKEDFTPYFSGKAVVILPDNDEPGWNHAQQVAGHLYGTAGSIKVIKLPGLPSKGDVSDWLAAGGTLKQLQELTTAAPEWVPVPHKVVEADDDPHRLARLFKTKYLKAVYWRGEIFILQDGAPHYLKLEEESLGAEITETIKEEFNRLNLEAIKKDPTENHVCKKVTISLRKNVIAALEAMTLLKAPSAPCWLTSDQPADCSGLFVGKTRLLDINTGEIIPKTPELFCTTSLNFDPDPNAPQPARWLQFVQEVFPGDQESQDTLQEWFGLLITKETRFQKILSLFGVPRSGKGIIQRTIRGLVGGDSVAAPKLNDFSYQFGLEGLLNASVAIIADARFNSKKEDDFTENLLAISGEDSIGVQRKGKSVVTCKLQTRVILTSNEPPAFTDASGALANRLILLRFNQSFLGREDIHLEDRITRELPGILNWAIAGWHRLKQRGHFIQPESGRDVVDQVRHYASPVMAFIDERCQIVNGARVTLDLLFNEWKKWCEAEGRQHAGTKGSFAKQLLSLPYDIIRRQGTGGVRFYEGLHLPVQSEDEF